MKKALALFALATAVAVSAKANIVINEVYAGGGNTGAPFSQDYVELFNNGNASVNIGGFDIQYATAAGAFGLSGNDVGVIPLGIILAPGAFYDITGSTAGANGVAPPANQQGDNVNFATGGGKIRLLDSSAAQLDLIGWGSATTFEGSAAAPAMTATVSDNRTNGIDTNQNGTDFTTGAPSPVPEPATWMLMGVGLLLGAQRLRRKS